MQHAVTLLTHAGARTVQVLDGATLLRAVLRARLPIGRSCRGEGVCAACRVIVVAGTVAPPDAVEAALAARERLPRDERYACRARLIAPVTLTTGYW